MDASAFVLDCRGHRLDCRPGRGALARRGAHVMGILNVTPDSFSDGGRYQSVEAAVARAEQMLTEGAALVDIGGESTRPAGSVYGAGAAQVAADEERRRVVPVVEALAKAFPEAVLSVDTYKPAVARAALDAGAHLINDITGLRHAPEMADVCTGYGAPLVVMHALGRPGQMPHSSSRSSGKPAYNDVVAEVKASLAASVKQAEAAGVRHIIVDPGFGFGKAVEENLRLVGQADAFVAMGRPVLVGISRKSTVGAVLNTAEAPAPVAERLYGTLGATAAAVARGATLVRTHDVRPTVEMLRLLAATFTAAGAATQKV